MWSLKIHEKSPLLGLGTGLAWSQVAGSVGGRESRLVRCNPANNPTLSKAWKITWNKKLLGAKGIATRNKKLLGAKGIATRSKDATRGSWPYY